MTTSPGGSLRKPSSRPIEGAPLPLAVAVAICLAFGVALALSDIFLRLPLHMPGWRGVIGMGLLVMARQLSGQIWGATCAALAAALAGAYGADAMRFGPFAYLASGLVIDLALARRPWRNSALLVGAAAGLANLAKFVVVLVAAMLLGHAMHGQGLHGQGMGGGQGLGAHGIGAYGMGVVLAVLGHVVFGFLGGLLVARVRRPESGAPGPRP